MAERTAHYYLIKAARLSAWLLLPLMVLYIGTGFALCGEFGFSRVVDKQTALLIHQLFEWPLIVAFVVHSSITVYFALRRWGWIKTRTCH
jgi:hypothetical protein